MLQLKLSAIRKEIAESRITKFVESKSVARAWIEFFDQLALEKSNIRLTPDHLPFTRPSDTQVKACWKQCQDLKNGNQFVFPDSCGDMNDENGALHPLLLELFKFILKDLNLDDTCTFCMRVNMRSPPLVPDFVQVRKGLAQPGFPDVQLSVEAKLPRNNDFKAGVQQATLYLKHSLGSLPKDDPDRRFRLGMFLDYAKIAVVYFDIDSTGRLSFQWTDVLELFPPNWRALESPTSGFEWLCRGLYAPRSLFEHSPMIIEAKGQRFNVVGCLSKDMISVYEIKHVDREEGLVAKKGGTIKYASGLIAVCLCLHSHFSPGHPGRDVAGV